MGRRFVFGGRQGIKLQQFPQRAGLVQRIKIRVATETLAVDHDLRNGVASSEIRQIDAGKPFQFDIDFIPLDAQRAQQGFCLLTVGTPVRHIHTYSSHSIILSSAHFQRWFALLCGVYAIGPGKVLPALQL